MDTQKLAEQLFRDWKKQAEARDRALYADTDSTDNYRYWNGRMDGIALSLTRLGYAISLGVSVKSHKLVKSPQ